MAAVRITQGVMIIQEAAITITVKLATTIYDRGVYKTSSIPRTTYANEYKAGHYNKATSA